MLTGCKSKSSGRLGQLALARRPPPTIQFRKNSRNWPAAARKTAAFSSRRLRPRWTPPVSARWTLHKPKTPFYVEYQLPGMNVAIAGNSQGKLFAVQSQTGGAGLDERRLSGGTARGAQRPSDLLRPRHIPHGRGSRLTHEHVDAASDGHRRSSGCPATGTPQVLSRIRNYNRRPNSRDAARRVFHNGGKRLASLP